MYFFFLYSLIPDVTLPRSSRTARASGRPVRSVRRQNIICHLRLRTDTQTAHRQHYILDAMLFLCDIIAIGAYNIIIINWLSARDVRPRVMRYTYNMITSCPILCSNGSCCRSRRYYFLPSLLYYIIVPGEYNLKLNPVTLDDDGAYQCQVGTGKRDEPAIRSRKATLTVLVPPNRPRIVQGEFATVTENVPLELECVSEGGKPPAEVSIYIYIYQHDTILCTINILSRSREKSKTQFSRCTAYARVHTRKVWILWNSNSGKRIRDVSN